MEITALKSQTEQMFKEALKAYFASKASGYSTEADMAYYKNKASGIQCVLEDVFKSTKEELDLIINTEIANRPQ